jgi:peptide/nickel transport system substrate-binding protein
MPSSAVMRSSPAAGRDATTRRVLAGFFGTVGIKMAIQAVEPGTSARCSRTTDFPATILVWNTTWDPKFFADYFTSQDATFNPLHVAPSPDVAKLSAEGLHANGTEQRLPIYHKLMGHLAEQSFIIYVRLPGDPVDLIVGIKDRARNTLWCANGSG